jgi:hypothetical protein
MRSAVVSILYDETNQVVGRFCSLVSVSNLMRNERGVG